MIEINFDSVKSQPDDTCFFYTENFQFRQPTLEDIQYLQSINTDSPYLVKLYLVYQRFHVGQLDFYQLRREQIREIAAPCIQIMGYSGINIDAILKNIYVINGQSFNGLEKYEKMTISKIQKLIRIHNLVKAEQTKK